MALGKRLIFFFVLTVCLGVSLPVAASSIHIEWSYEVPQEKTVAGVILYLEGVPIAKVTNYTLVDQTYSADIEGLYLRAEDLYTLIVLFTDGTESPASPTYSAFADGSQINIWRKVLILLFGKPHARLDGTQPAMLSAE